MKSLGVDAYRFSISWPRLFPENSSNLNEEGVAFYNAVIDCALEAGLTPFVTLYHWDLPQFLENDPEVKGWRTKSIINHFVIFASTCFNCFGDRVKHWITFNEIHLIAIFAHGWGYFAPGTTSNKSTEPYVVAHHQLLAHAATVKIYRADYQKKQKGAIGLSAVVGWTEPFTKSQVDKDAAERFQAFESGWILDPVQFGDYPRIMRDLVGDRLPKFTAQESEDLKGSADFLGINYYTAIWARNREEKVSEDDKWWDNDSQADTFGEDPDGNRIGEFMGPEGLVWFRSCPWGLRKALAWIKNRYGNIALYITENGTLDPDGAAPLDKALDDQHRIKFVSAHLRAAAESIRQDHVNLKGFFLWTYMDNWEWFSGFKFRFGFYYVDFNHSQLLRYPKASAKWLSSFLSS